ncbi:MAG: FliM/FliN family flagellar motor switch protein [Planctomycetes bacterium]|nr:FliM/FliN family flagellar motor switch protein [Planctomycetota bacterium]
MPRAPGSLIQLDRYDHGPVDILVTAKVVARGEFVTIDPSDAVPRTSVAKPG